MRRAAGRVTFEDIRSAGLRRWDGRLRITTDWINVFHVSIYSIFSCVVLICRPGTRAVLAYRRLSGLST